MNVSCMPGGIIEYRRPGQGVSDLCRGGFSHAALDLRELCAEGELENLGRERPGGAAPARKPAAGEPALLGQYARELAEAYRGKLELSVARAPYLSRDTRRADLNGRLEELAAEGIRTCGALDCRFIMVRPLFAGVERGAEWAVNRDFYLRLGAEARRAGVTVLLENQCRDYNGHLIRGLCSDPAQAAQWVDRLNGEMGEERFGFCLNTGTCRLCGQDMGPFAAALGRRLKAVILRECVGQRENSLLPFTAPAQDQSQAAWIGLIRGLREAGFDGELVLDLPDTAAAFSPLLRPAVLTLAHQVGEYFKWQIQLELTLKSCPSIVLFGAGNMCRNYMRCYGERYRPLFTCSNSPGSWGSQFCGLEVRPPEALRDLPPDCVVLICNVYYREVEDQLREMGLPNRIAYFNDEYMPSFQFDGQRGG